MELTLEDLKMLDIYEDYKKETINAQDFVIYKKTLCAITYTKNGETKTSDIKRLEFLLLGDFYDEKLILYDITPCVDDKGIPYLLLDCDLEEK